MHPLFRLAALATLLGLAACASPEQRIANKLVDLGLPPEPARCMARELDDRLTRSQLQRLADAVRAAERRGGLERMTVGEVARQVEGIGDPEIMAVLTRAGLGCAVLG